MLTYFVISDIHSYATEMKEALMQAGFQLNNEEHILIVCGDVFDRGKETIEVYNFLNSIPENRVILIRGNHELLYMNLLKKDKFQLHDLFNGTVQTFCSIANENIQKLSSSYWAPFIQDANIIDKTINNLWKKIKNIVLKSEITKWIKSAKWINYYELDNYIFVHSFIPLKIKDTFISSTLEYPKYKIDNEYLEYDPSWRKIKIQKEWDEATWGCPWKLFRAGFFNQEIDNNKILVCGHWRVNDFHKSFEGKEDDYSIFFSKNLIALDGCTALTKNVNVLVIQNDHCYDKYKNELKES